MLTAYCRNCGGPKEPSEYAANTCGTCTTTRLEAEQAFAAEHKDAPESDILYAGRQALLNRAHHANRNFTDPRGFSASRGMLPTPPNAGDRGTVPE